MESFAYNVPEIEAAEYEDCVEAIDFISLLQAKARRYLNRSSVEKNG